MQPNYGMPQQMPMQQQFGTPQMTEYMQRAQNNINEMQNRLQQQMQQMAQMSQMQVPSQPAQQQAQQQAAMIIVSSMEEAQNYAPDISGTMQWFTDGKRIYSKQFNVKTAGLEFHKYKVDDSDEPEGEETTSEPAERSWEGGSYMPDKLNALEAKIAAIEANIVDIEGVLKDANTARSHADDSATAKSGDEPKANNRQRATAKPRIEK